MKHERLTYLINRFADKTISAEEKAALLDLLHTHDEAELAEAGFTAWMNETLPPADISQDILEQQVKAILSTDKPTRGRIVHLRRWGWAAACIILALGIGLYYKAFRKTPVVPVQVADIQPGHNGATLTLANGDVITLDSLNNREVATQNGAKVVLQNGGLVYHAATTTGQTVFNTMSTSKGRQFRLVLPDSTQVWLNAASTITYPTAFTGKERSVTVTGEAYFEVAKNADMPFRVNVNGVESIEVLGTSFNVNAYPDEESVNTTLLTGSIRVMHNKAITLKPGQQAQVANGQIKVTDADMDKVIAWKNGTFDFEDAKLAEVMRQLERWYDIDVVYEHGVPDIEFGGKITKGVTLNGLLVLLQRADVHFRLEGRKLIIMQ